MRIFDRELFDSRLRLLRLDCRLGMGQIRLYNGEFICYSFEAPDGILKIKDRQHMSAERGPFLDSLIYMAREMRRQSGKLNKWER